MRILRGTVSCQHCAASSSDDPDFYEKEKPVQGPSVPDYDIIGKQVGECSGKHQGSETSCLFVVKIPGEQNGLDSECS